VKEKEAIQEGNQQRRTVMVPVLRLPDGNSTDASEIAGRDLIITRALANQLRKPITPARINPRKRAAARIESKAVTGPCTAE
jgi:hypothetical protein